MEPNEQQQPPAGAAPNIDPRMLETYQRLDLAAMKIIYNPEVARSLVEMMKAGEPAESVAGAAMHVLDRIRQQAKGIDPRMVDAVAPAVVARVCELGAAAGLFKPDQALIAAVAEIVKGSAGGAQPPADGEPPAQERPDEGGGLIKQEMGA